MVFLPCVGEVPHGFELINQKACSWEDFVIGAVW